MYHLAGGAADGARAWHRGRGDLTGGPHDVRATTPSKENPMQLRRLGPIGQEKPALVRDGVTYRLEALTDDITVAFMADGGLEQAITALESGELPVWDGAEEERIGAPIARPEAVICIGQNYAAHAAE